MAGSGIYWFTGPDKYVQKMSIALNDLPGIALEAVNKVQEHAVERMHDVINAGGMNATKKGGARILSGKMIDSAQGRAWLNGRNRAQGEFGFVDPPDWTEFQESGTRYIAPMWAYAEAHEAAVVELSNQVHTTKWFPSFTR